MALYNEERPVEFSQVKGQDKVVKILSHDLSKGVVKNAYLFCGVRGTGKTTIARILAQAVNCDHLKEDGSPCGVCESCRDIRSNTSVDVFELDAASNNGVDDIRAILEKVQYKPIHKKKVFILDEVHMLSPAASNALLKVLEEPPEDVIFILCTTERHKILPTIISRCSVYEFEKISRETISDHLAEVCDKHGVAYEKKALDVIAKSADGAMRDALSILDKFISCGTISVDQVVDALGLATDEIVFGILNAIADKNPSGAVDMLKKHAGKGGSLSCLIEELFGVLLDMVEFQKTGDKESLVGSDEYVDGIVDIAFRFSTERAFQLMNELRRVYQQKSGNITFSLMTAFISAIYEDNSAETLKAEVDVLKEKVSTLEKEIQILKENGVSASPASTGTQVPESTAIDNSSTEQCTNNSIGEITDNNAERSEEEIPNGCGIFDEDFLYDSCMKEFDSIPNFDSVPEAQSSAEIPSSEPNKRITAQKESVLDSPTHADNDTPSSLGSMESVPDGLSFDELAQMAGDGAFDNNGSSNAEEGGLASPKDSADVYPDSVGDAFARLFTESVGKAWAKLFPDDIFS